MSPILFAQRGLLFQFKSSSFRKCWKGFHLSAVSLSRSPFMLPWTDWMINATSHHWPYPVCENIVTCLILPHAIISDAHSSSKHTVFNLWGGAEDSGGGGGGGLEKRSGTGGTLGHSAMWGQFKSAWNETRKQAQQSGTVGCPARRTQESQWCILAALATQFWIQSDDLTSLVQTKISRNHHEILYRRSWFPDDTSPVFRKMSALAPPAGLRM